MTTEIVSADTKPAMLRPIVKPAEAMQVHTEMVTFINQVLKPGVDFGTIPGAGDKLGLFKAGAERIMAGFGLRAEFEVIESEVDNNLAVPFALTKWVASQNKPSQAIQDDMKAKGSGRFRKSNNGWQWQEAITEDGTSLGLYRYSIRAILYFGDRRVGEGVGSCSTMETKYIRTPRDYENTVLKMAKKRALVDAVLTTVGLSDRFTQDVEDLPRETPQVVDAEPEEPARNAALDKEVEAKNYLKSVGIVTKKGYADYEEECKKIGTDPLDFALSTKAKGITTDAALYDFLATLKPYNPEDEIIDAEVVA